MSKRNSQASMEYMLIAFAVALIIIPTTYLFYTYASGTSKQIDYSQIDKIGREVITAAEKVYYLGAPSKVTLDQTLPENVQAITVEQDPTTQNYILKITAKTPDGQTTDFAYVTSVKLESSFLGGDLSGGAKEVTVMAVKGQNGKLAVGITFRGVCETNAECFGTETCQQGICLGCECGTCQTEATPSHCTTCAVDAGATCTGGECKDGTPPYCQLCGTIGEVCCNTKTPDCSQGACIGGTCQLCGEDGQFCCPPDDTCNAGKACDTGTCYTIGTLSLALNQPATDTTVVEAQTLTLQATATCNAGSCGVVEMRAKQETSPGAGQQDIPPAGTPFTTPTSAQSCGLMLSGATCQKTWTITATGTGGENRRVYADATSPAPYSLAATSEPSSKLATITLPQCKDGVDNDGDGRIDYPLDFGCASQLDDEEMNVMSAFITTNTFQGNLGGFAGADSTCRVFADSVPVLSGKTWAAWLSDTNIDAKDRIDNARFVRTDGAVIANSKADLTDGSIQNPINLDANKNPVPAGSEVWTGTNAAGTKEALDTCHDWSTTLPPATGRVGDASAINSAWTNKNVNQLCKGFLRIYCFETPPPEITSVDPAFGTPAGGTSITITGKDFKTGATVTIKGSRATNVIVVNPTTITATTPAGAVGDAPIIVTDSDGPSPVKTGVYLYYTERRKVFVTSSLHNGNLGGLAGADAKCKALADAVPELSGKKWAAWLSATNIDAKDRILDDVYERTDKVIVANNKADIIDGTIENPIDKDENKENVPSPQWVWTNTRKQGIRYQNSPCNGGSGDWKSSSTGLKTVIGDSTKFNVDWTAFSANGGCELTTKRLYCFEVS